jgi:hypothetical protein
MTATARAKAEAAYAQLMGLRGEIAGARELSREWPAVADKLAREGKPGPRGLKLSALTENEREILGQVFPHVDDLESLTLADITRARGRAGAEYAKLLADEESAIARLRDSTQPLYDKVRAASPRERTRWDVIDRAKGLDQVSGMPPISGQLQADHIVPLRQIVDMPGFARLDWTDQVAIADLRSNLRAVDGRVNGSRGGRSWAEPFPQRGTYSQSALAELQTEIDNRLRAAGRPIGAP